MAEISALRVSRYRRRRRRRIAAALLAAAVLAACGWGIAYAGTRPTLPSYRTAVAAMGSVDSSVSTVGTVQDAQQRSASFSVGGTVKAVAVAVGQSVHAGEVLATLDTTTLSSALSAAKTDLTDAQQTLANDTAAQAAANAAVASASSAAAASSTSAAGTSAAATTPVRAAAVQVGRAPTGNTGNGSSDTSAATSAGSAGPAGVAPGRGGTAGGAPGTGGSNPPTGSRSGHAGAGASGASGAGTATSGASLQQRISQAQQAITGCQQVIDILLGKALADPMANCPGAAAPTDVGAAGTTAPSMVTTPAASTTPATSSAPGVVRAAAASGPVGDAAATAGGTDTTTQGDPLGDPDGAHQGFGGRPATSSGSTPTGSPAPARSAGGAGGPGAGTIGAPGAGTTGAATVSLAASCQALLAAPSGTATTVTATVTDRGTVTVTATVTDTATVTPTAGGGTTSTTSSPTATTTATSTATSTPTSTPTPTPSALSGDTSTDTAGTGSGGRTDPPAPGLHGPGGAWQQTRPSPPSHSSPAPDDTVPTTGEATGTAPSSDTATTAAGGPAAGVSPALAACQQAVGDALDDLDSLYAWETALDADLQQPMSAQGGSTGPGSTRTAPSGQTTGGHAQAGAGQGANGKGDTGSAGTAGNGQNPGQLAGGGHVGGGATGGSAASAGAARTSRVPTGADLAADQAQFDVRGSDVAIAQQNLAAAELTSPIAGTVAQVAMSAGDRVNASSTSETITVLGRTSYLVTASIPLTAIDLVKAGQRASVVVDGNTTPVTGTVSQIGILDDSSTATPSYPVTIALDPAGSTLFDGSGASVSIAVGSVSGVLTVPTSAVHTTGTTDTVTVLDGTALKQVTVRIGLVGADLTQITSGLVAGQIVVLADLGQPLPTQSVAAGRAGRIAAGAGGGLGGGAGLGGGGSRFGAGGFGRGGG